MSMYFIIGTGAYRTVIIDRYTVQGLSSYLSPHFSTDATAMKWSSGGPKNEILLEVPLGEMEANVGLTIKVTTYLDPPAPGTDQDPYIGLHDTSFSNEFFFTDTLNWANNGMGCAPLNADHDANTPGRRGYNAGMVVMIFKPVSKMGMCYLPLDGGFTNSAAFHYTLDPTKGLLLRFRRDTSGEHYRIFSFNVEIFE